MAVSRDMEN